jgi:glycosyltransferase involved in cell wall biosynthesis
MSILLVGDCVSWAIDRLVKPISEKLKIDYVYTDNSETRWKRTGYTNLEDTNKLKVYMFETHDIIHHWNLRALQMILKGYKKELEGKKIISTICTERDIEETIKDETFDRIDKFVAVTRYNEEKLVKRFGKDKVVYIPFAVDKDYFKFIKDYPKNEKTLGYVGRVVKWKHLKEIAEIAKDLKIELKACGYTDDCDYWRSCPPMKLSMVQQESLVEYMSKFTIYCAISDPYIETGPLPVLECISLGIPVITTKVGWAKDHLTHGESVYFVKDTGKDTLLRAVKELLSNKELMSNIRLNARKVIEQWNINHYIETHRRLYETMSKK